jgi:hypothetical protein
MTIPQILMLSTVQKILSALVFPSGLPRWMPGHILPAKQKKYIYTHIHTLYDDTDRHAYMHYIHTHKKMNQTKKYSAFAWAEGSLLYSQGATRSYPAPSICSPTFYYISILILFSHLYILPHLFRYFEYNFVFPIPTHLTFLHLTRQATSYAATR